MEDHAIAPAPAMPLAIDRGALPMAEVVGRVAKIQNVMSTLMKPDVHYGTIPGTPKPTLYQPGAELLCMTFRIAPTPRVEDLSTSDEVRYRVTVAGVNQATGEQLGEGVGECSSSEEKYRWRRPVCDEEWNETPEERRREKWMRGRSGNYKAKQVRTSPPDVANTILKMAYKRALISMTRVTLACSDIFAQDLEDLSEELREQLTEQPAGTGEPKMQPPQRKAATPPPPPPKQQTAKPAGNGGGLLVVKVETKRGTTNGKPWTVHIVELSNGKRASTFDEGVMQAAAAACSDRIPVDVSLEPGKKDGTWRLVEIVPASESTEAEEEEDF